MATQCRSSKCTAERKGFRRELDSWRHKLIQCVGFESILEGIYGPRLLQDLSIFDECEPEPVDYWSVDENCSFCNLPLEKLNVDHAVAISGSPTATETPQPQGLCTSDNLLSQADQFLYAVFHKKEFPQSCDPSIPLVAQELMRKMIQQFALEYATKSQSLKGLNGSSDNSEALLKHDLDGPLDLTVSRASPTLKGDGVLDLSKKNMSPEKETTQQKVSETPIRGDYLDRSSEFAEGLLSKALKDVQSGSLDINKAAILYGIPQKTLLLQTEALLSEWKPREQQIHFQSDVVGPTSDALLLQKVAAWSSSQSEVRKCKASSPELNFPVGVTASSYLHHLTLQRMVLQLREQRENPNTAPHSLGSRPTAQIRIPQVRYSAQPKAQLDLAGLVDVVYQVNKAPDSSTAFNKLKPILPKQSLVESHCSLESRLLQGDLPPLCLNMKNGSLGGSVTGSLVDFDDDHRDKQPRKKRGRYRQYDHDILEEAIAMVINGKMSVSKAQGVYGVPHSTLEYKVKERTGMLKTPPKKKLRLTEVPSSGSGKSGTTTNASCTTSKQS